MISMAHLLKEHVTVMSQLEERLPLIEKVADRMRVALEAGGKIFFMGNGGSAADAQHLACELVCRFKLERQSLAAIALTTDTSLLTAISNDYGYDQIFSRQLEGLCQARDVVVGISTSGNSLNVLKGIETAKRIGAYTVVLTGRSGGQLISLADLCLCVPSDNVARIQEAHIFIGHSMCELIENAVAKTTFEINEQAVA